MTWLKESTICLGCRCPASVNITTGRTEGEEPIQYIWAMLACVTKLREPHAAGTYPYWLSVILSVGVTQPLPKKAWRHPKPHDSPALPRCPKPEHFFHTEPCQVRRVCSALRLSRSVACSVAHGEPFHRSFFIKLPVHAPGWHLQSIDLQLVNCLALCSTWMYKYHDSICTSRSFCAPFTISSSILPITRETTAPETWRNAMFSNLINMESIVMAFNM